MDKFCIVTEASLAQFTGAKRRALVFS